MAYRNHSIAEIREIEARVRTVADLLGKIASEMQDLGVDSIELQTDSVMNHKFSPVEDWSVKVQIEADKQLRKVRRGKVAEVQPAKKGVKRPAKK